MDVQHFLTELARRPRGAGRVVDVRVLEARPAVYAAPRAPLPERLARLLAAEGAAQLYSHQAEALDAVQRGENVVICTGTASGKSLCAHLPVLAALLEDAEARALYLFPAKALAYDQLAALERMVQRAGLAGAARPACYDGDTPQHQRPGIRRNATILLSNPDMLHVGILPYHAKWAGFLARLRFVVLDEIHTYRGIFGSHVANVLRRLQRLCGHYGARPQFICCSATVGNPREHAERLTGRAMRLVDRDGSPRGRKHFVLWNPPFVRLSQGEQSRALEQSRASEPSRAVPSTAVHSTAILRTAIPSTAVPSTALLNTTLRSITTESPADARVGTRGLGSGDAHDRVGSGGLGHRRDACATGTGGLGSGVARRSANVEAQELMQRLLENDASVIAFCKARVVAELIYRYLVESLGRRRRDLAAKVRPYRGGYLPNERREIERQLFSGALRGVCSTNALELGIDVGTLDAAILIGFPGTFASLWQQAGRAGRRQDDSLAVLVAYDDPIDQYLMRHPDFVFERPIERAVIDPQNPHILAAQLRCAAFELSLSAADLAAFGGDAEEIAQALSDAGEMKRSDGRLYWSDAEMPHAKTSLRTISDATFAIVDVSGGGSAVVGQVDSISAPELVYPQAIYLHQGESYLVRALDMQARLAKVERADVDYYTQPVLASQIFARQARIERGLHGGRRIFGDVTVQWQTIAFKKFRFQTMEMIGQTALDLPPQRINTTALWLQPPIEALEAVAAAGRRPLEGLCGVRNLLTVALPALAMCDRYDIGGICDSSQLGRPTVFLYDRFEGGVGYARRGFEDAERLMLVARELVEGCACEAGCPACVAPPNLRVAIHHDPDTYHLIETPDKEATRLLLSAWAGAPENDADASPDNHSEQYTPSSRT